MESWSHVSGGGKGCVANETHSPSDSSARSKNALMGWELKTPYSFVSNTQVSGQQGVESQSFGGFGIQELEEKRLHNNSIRDDLSAKVGVGVGFGFGRIMNHFMPAPNTIIGEDESNSSSKLSSSVVDSNSSRDSSLIDLKLGRFPDQTQRDAHHDSKISRAASNPILSSSESTTPLKRVRLAGVNLHIAYCQVYGCNKDLSSSKDYHKRHKVCEAHSKTAKVIVNGIEQRFCQQCSRFHLLAEFDNGKRSCRKRLAGHNERRRKPQVGMHSGKSGKLLPSYNAFPDSRYQGNTLITSSFICQDIFPRGILHLEKCGTNDCYKHIEPADGTDHSPLSSIPITNGNLHSKSLFPPYNFGKAVPSFHDNGAGTGTENTFNLNSTQYSHDMGGPNSGSSPLFQDASMESEDFTGFDTASTILGLSGNSDTGCALSLLSSKPQHSTSHLSGTPLTRHLVIPGSYNHYGLGRITEKLIGISSQASTSGTSNKFSSSGINSVGGNLGNIVISDRSAAGNFDINNGNYQGSDCMNTKDHLSCEDGATIDLLQLSSQLQQVEHQRQSMQFKHENDAFCCL